METVKYGDSIEVDFNGILFLAKDRHYSAQYLGSGKTEVKALDDMYKTIIEKKFKFRQELFLK